MKMQYCHNVTLVWCIMIHSLQQIIDEYSPSPFLRNNMYTHGRVKSMYGKTNTML